MKLHHPDRYDPWRHAETLDLRIVFRQLPGDLMGVYFHGPSRVIALDSRLTQVERRCTLAHELVHLERGDGGRCATDWHESKQEQQVHQVAARRLIRAEDLALALILHEHPYAQAEELWVDEMTLATRLAGLSTVEREELAELCRPVYRRRSA